MHSHCRCLSMCPPQRGAKQPGQNTHSGGHLPSPACPARTSSYSRGSTGFRLARSTPRLHLCSAAAQPLALRRGGLGLARVHGAGLPAAQQVQVSALDALQWPGRPQAA